jgi:P27 family predicted phage terminase small subunit
MPGKGFPAAPLEKAIARGTQGAAKRSASAPPRVEGIPNPPAWLDPVALECWVSVCDLLFARGQLTQESAPSLAALCVCYSDWVDLAQDLRANGRTTTNWSPTGGAKTVARPEAVIFADTDRRFKAWLTEFGLTDASRGKVAGSPQEAADPTNPLGAYGLQ